MSVLTNLATRITGNRVQRRQIHLVHEIWTMFPSGKLARCKEQKLTIQPKPFGLQTKSGKTITITSVKQVLEHIKPMTHLEKLDGENLYRVSSLDPPPDVKKPTGEILEEPGRRDGGAREVHLKTNANSTYLKHVLSKAYEVLCFKNLKLRKVEFHVRTEKDKAIEWALENCPHLRPEVILAAMPLGTKVLAPALVDGETKLRWALHFGHIPPEMRNKKPKGDKAAKGIAEGEENPHVGAISTRETNVRDSIPSKDGETALGRKNKFKEETENAQRMSRVQKKEARTDRVLPREVGEQAREKQSHKDLSTKTSDHDDKAAGKYRALVLENEQMWEEPTRLFMRAWKRTPYQGLQRTPEQALAKRQKDLERRAQNKDSAKRIKVKHKPKRKKYKVI